MLQKVTIDGIDLPRLYIAENAKDVAIAKKNGVPYVRWTDGQESLIELLLRPVLVDMFPHIKWDRVLGYKRKFYTKVNVVDGEARALDQLELAGRCKDDGHEFVHDDESEPSYDSSSACDPDVDDDGVLYEDADMAANERVFSGYGCECNYTKLDLADYVGDMSSYVNIDILQRLRLMPKFIGDILDCIKINIGSGIYWREGYNKRRDLPVGRFDSSRQLPNLIILDVSGSIPRGISATMIALINTLRSQLSADLIITSNISKFYAMGDELPDPYSIRRKFGFGNEAGMFFEILDKNIKGRHYGHVFSFGDNDTPEYFKDDYDTFQEMPSMCGTIVEHVHHYHTGQFWGGDTSGKTGYAKWCHMLQKKPAEEYNTSWCEYIER